MIETKDIMNLKGPVKSCSETAYFVRGGKIEKDEFHNHYIEFNDNGFAKTLINIDYDVSFKYKSNLNILGLKKYPLKFEHLRQVALDGETKQYQSESSHYFNKDGKIVNSIFLNYKNDIAAYTRYFYDDFSRLVKVINYRVNEFKCIDEVFNIEKFEYNFNDEIIASKICYPEDCDIPNTIQQFELNDKGDIIVQKTIDDFNVVTTTIEFIYIYDQHQNWIKKSAFENGKKYMFIKRDLKYS